MKRLRHSRDKRSFRAYDSEVRADRFGESCETGGVIDIDRQARGDLADARVARRAVKLRRVRTARELPRYGVLSSAGPDYQDFHLCVFAVLGVFARNLTLNANFTKIRSTS